MQEPNAIGCAEMLPSAAIMATPTDYAHFAEALLADGGKMLSPDSVKTMEAAHADPSTLEMRYGFGIESRPFAYGPTLILTHDGSLPGFLSRVTVVPSTNFAVITMMNARGAAVGGGPSTVSCGRSRCIRRDAGAPWQR